MRVIAAGIALILLEGCVPASKPPVAVSPIMVSSAEDRRDRDRLSSVLLAKWSQCQVGKAREVAHLDLPAPEAVREAFKRCNTEREEWLRAQGSNNRYAAEQAASDSETHVFPVILKVITEIREKQRLKPITSAEPDEISSSTEAGKFWSDCALYNAADFALKLVDIPAEEAARRTLDRCAPARAQYVRAMVELGEPGEQAAALAEPRLKITILRLIRELRETVH